jgi:hypothetical protein
LEKKTALEAQIVGKQEKKLKEVPISDCNNL